MSFLPLVRIWIWLSVVASLAGWGLSVLGQLNVRGYLAVLAGLALVLVWRGRGREWDGSGVAVSWNKTRRRFRRALPLCFVALSLLAFVGGALYPTTNHTALTYRIPRVLQWLAEGQWHWIHTGDYRMNNRACGIEWLSAPMLLFTRSDRGLFLINFIPFLLLPGLIYSVFARLGVRPRVAWQWMWLLPTGYSFLLQAASTGNDTFPVVYSLAAVDFGLRAWETRRISDVWLSGISAALLTGAKASNLPLLLPWAIVIFPLLWLLKGRPAISFLMVLVGAAVSFLPTMLLNVHYCGDWSGLRLERAGMDMKDPLVGVWGNSLLFLLGNFVPPFFPLASWWNQRALSVLPSGLIRPMVANFEEGFHKLWELPTEDWAGIGFGLSVLILVSVVGCLRGGIQWRRAWAGSSAVPASVRWCVLAGGWAALLAYCMKSGMVTGPRLITPYYPLLLPLILIPRGQAEMVRRRWWRWMVGGVLFLAFMVLVVTPARPLFPARTIFSKLRDLCPGQRLPDRALDTYSVYANRWDPLANVRSLIPEKATIIGFMADPDDMDISLWRPIGTRRVKHVLLGDTPEWIRGQQIEYLVVGGAKLAVSGVTFEDWLRQSGAQCIGKATAVLKVSEGAQPWYVVRFPQPGGAGNRNPTPLFLGGIEGGESSNGTGSSALR